jgi:hypothetical protein
MREQMDKEAEDAWKLDRAQVCETVALIPAGASTVRDNGDSVAANDSLREQMEKEARTRGSWTALRCVR